MPHPFPEIPRWSTRDADTDEPNDARLVPDEPPLEGAPKSPADSILLSIPGLSKAADKAVAFGKAKNYAEQQKVVRETVHELLSDARGLTDFLDGLDTIKEVRAYENLKRFKREMMSALENITIPADAMVAERWITLYAESKVYATLAETVLRNSFAGCQSEAAVVDLAYAVALGGLKSSNEKVVTKTIKILHYQTPVIPPGGKTARLYLMSSISDDEDIFLRKREIDNVASALVRVRFPELEAKIKANLEKLTLNQATVGAVRRRQQTPGGGIDRFARILRMVKANKSLSAADHTRMMEMIRQDPTAETAAKVFAQFGIESGADLEMVNKVGRGGELHQWHADLRAEEISTQSDQAYIGVHLPQFHGALPLNRSVLREAIISRLMLGQPEQMSDEQYWRTLAHVLPPEFDTREFREQALPALRELNDFYSRDLSGDTMHLLSPRGDSVDIEDPMLTAIGITKIELQMDERNKRDTAVTLDIGRAKYRILLDQYAALRDIKNPDHPVNLPDDGEFIRAVILGYTHAVRCTEFANEQSDSGTESGVLLRGGRRAHRRVLPKGKKPTRDQIITIWKKYEVDINRLNAERLAEHQAQGLPVDEFKLATYVSQVDPLEDSGSPVELKAPKTTERLRAALRFPPLASLVR